LIDRFGRFGYDLYRHARGISNSPVKPNRIRKSVGSERTYRKLLYAEEDVKAELAKNAERVARTLEKMDARGRSIVIKVRYSDFETLTKRITLEDPTRSLDLIQQTAFEIYDQLDENTRGIRLLGVTVTSLVYGAENITLDLGYSEKT
jgi:DNA polymerase-4